MIADLKPYAEYKDSGQDWLGNVPRHRTLAPRHSANGGSRAALAPMGR